ncbi:MAG TPA: ribosome-associated translation inhibitor RaiA [Oxalicibacterium sp.]|uniref:ribosome hibernation-promoting factor, HPF/YfiA family n=1 Tax=Oxalicibacterium sp. TaxID=2766525 RepID=UPI002BA53367|nr:ribosome-associated translation inhibitor RaiA [Oxalicibacterium sp.]HWU98331.1 ribosome-associated translation inhibitor RaiA [Oxalicibacterium sp.]
MNILISGHHLELTPGIREYITTKLERITRHCDRIIEIDVTLSVDTLPQKEMRQRAEVNLRLKGETLHAEDQAQDLYAAIDGLMEKLDRQVAKSKGRIKDHRQESTKRMTANSTFDEETEFQPEERTETQRQ